MTVEGLKRIVEDGIESGEVEQIKSLEQMVDSLSPSDKEEMIEIIEAAESDANEDAKIALGSLKESIEVSMESAEYSMKGIESINTSESFEELFSTGLGEIHSSWVGGKLKDYPTFADHQKSVEVVAWRYIMEKISFGGMTSHAGGVISRFFTEKISSVQDAVSNLEQTEGSEGIEGIGGVIGNIQNIIDAVQNGEEVQQQDQEGFLSFLESITRPFFNNIGALHSLTVSEGLTPQETASILQNPYILSAVLSEGKYNENGFNIDLESGVLELGEVSQNMEELKSKFIQEVGNLTSERGNFIDRMRRQKDTIVRILDRFDFDGDSVENFGAELARFPMIGGLLKIIWDMFMGNGIADALRRFQGNKKIERSLENFGNYLKNPGNSDNIPFTVSENGLSDSEVSILKSFLNKSLTHEKELQAEDTIIDDDNFWELTFQEQESEDMSPTLLEIRKVMEEIHGNEDISQEEFFTRLKEVKFESTEVEEEVGNETETTEQEEGEEQPTDQTESPNDRGAQSEDTVAMAPVVDGIGETVREGEHQDSTDTIEEDIDETEEVIPTLVEQIEEIQALPASLKLENGEEVLVDIGNDALSIVINNESYPISMTTDSMVGSISILKKVSFENGLQIEHLVGLTETDTTTMTSEKLSEIIISLRETGSFSETVTTPEGKKVITQISRAGLGTV